MRIAAMRPQPQGRLREQGGAIAQIAKEQRNTKSRAAVALAPVAPALVEGTPLDATEGVGPKQPGTWQKKL